MRKQDGRVHVIDVVSSSVRSCMMAGIKGKNTKPELLVRKLLFAKGFRYRIHVRNLAGKPDLVFPKYRAVLFIHGCFWHGHNCHLFKWPKSRKVFWKNKITGNRLVDRRSCRALGKDNWRILIVWECAIKGRNRLTPQILADRIEKWLLSCNKMKTITGETK